MEGSALVAHRTGHHDGVAQCQLRHQSLGPADGHDRPSPRAITSSRKAAANGAPTPVWTTARRCPRQGTSWTGCSPCAASNAVTWCAPGREANTESTSLKKHKTTHEGISTGSSTSEGSMTPGASRSSSSKGKSRFDMVTEAHRDHEVCPAGIGACATRPPRVLYDPPATTTLCHRGAARRRGDAGDRSLTGNASGAGATLDVRSDRWGPFLGRGGLANDEPWGPSRRRRRGNGCTSTSGSWARTTSSDVVDGGCVVQPEPVHQGCRSGQASSGATVCSQNPFELVSLLKLLASYSHGFSKSRRDSQIPRGRTELVSIAAQVWPEVWHRECDSPAFTGVDQSLLD